MREQLEQRLQTLRNEFETGQAQLRGLERQQMLLRETLLRISGAIQVLEEALAGADDGAGEGNGALYSVAAEEHAHS